MQPSTHRSSGKDLPRLAQEASTGTDRRMQESNFRQVIAQLEDSEGPLARIKALRQTLASLLEKNASQIRGLQYPPSVQALIEGEFDRIRRVVEEGDDEYFDLRQHRVRCDYRIACFGRVPVGPEHFEVDGIPRRLLVSGGLGQCIRFLRLTYQTGGFRPFFVLHLAHNIPRAAFAFVYNANAQLAMFRNLAACMEMHPQCRGIMGGGWLLDPQLERVSPHLAHLRKGWVDNGAYLFRWQYDEDMVRYATVRSRHRQDLVQKGEFNPTSYLAIWPRDSLIAWSKRADPGA